MRNSRVDMNSSEVGTPRLSKSSQDGTHPAQEDSATNLAEVYALYNHMIQLYVSDFQIQLFCVMSIFISRGICIASQQPVVVHVFLLVSCLGHLSEW